MRRCDVCGDSLAPNHPREFAPRHRSCVGVVVAIRLLLGARDADRLARFFLRRRAA